MTKKHVKRMLAALLAALTLLSLAACGNTAAGSDAPDAPAAQEQTDEKKDNTAKTGDKTGSKTGDTKKNDTATGGTTTDKDGKKTDTSDGKNTPDTTSGKPVVTDNGQQGTTTSGGKDTSGKDNSGKTETPAAPTQPETPSTPSGPSCTISISCGTILANWDAWDEWDEETAAAKKPLVPSDGVILPSTTVTFSEGESVYDVLQRVCRENGIHMESSWTPMYNSAYVEGINNLYEFDVSQGSGWMYRVNGWFPNYGCSRYALQNGDVVEWLYTCDLGNDVGGGYAAG